MSRTKQAGLLLIPIIVICFLVWSFSKQGIVLTAAPGETIEAEIPTKYVLRQAWIVGVPNAGLNISGILSNREEDYLTQQYVCDGGLTGPYIDTLFKDGQRRVILINKCNQEVKLELSWFNFAPWNELYIKTASNP